MQCPKCNHIQAEAAECRKCGLIFAKYEAYEQRKKDLAEKKSQTKDERKSGFLKFSQVIVLILVVGATTYYFTKPKTTELQLAENPGQASEVEVIEVEDKSSNDEKSSDIETKKPIAVSPLLVGSPVERARKATVSIETPWGTGSGFFVEKNHIVTNKHVIEFNPSDLKEMRDKIRTNRRLIDLEEEKIEELRQQMEEMPDGPTKSQLEIIIKEREKYLAKVMKQQRENEKHLAKLEREAANPEIKIVLSDGTSHTIGYMLKSANYDLALLSLYSHDGNSFLRRPPEGRSIRQGDKVFTIGSPVGLRHTVTSGVFSGFRQRDTDDQVFLQTDAAINPGNSGGPLIDENGFVHGVNTMIVRDTEGIGFAIPIEKVFEEFSSTLE